MKYRKFNKYEMKEVRQEILTKALHGEGLYLYQNNTNGDLKLPRPTNSGVQSVGSRQQFQGDNYYMQLVRTGELRLIKEIQAPQVNIMENKLILDQPDTITQKGKVEHVVETEAPKKLNEEETSQEEVLLNENPVTDGFVIVGK